MQQFMLFQHLFILLHMKPRPDNWGIVLCFIAKPLHPSWSRRIEGPLRIWPLDLQCWKLRLYATCIKKPRESKLQSYCHTRVTDDRQQTDRRHTKTIAKHCNANCNVQLIEKKNENKKGKTNINWMTEVEEDMTKNCLRRVSDLM